MTVLKIALCILLVTLFACSEAPKKAETGPEMTARQVISHIMNEEYEPIIAQFDSTMKANVRKVQLVEIYESLNAQCGEFDKQGELKTFHEPPYDIVYVEMIFSDIPYWGKVILNPEGKIAGLRFMPSVPDETTSPIADYIDPDKFTSRGGEFGVEEWRLPAVVTLPNGPGPFPAVILIHMHGAYDKDETVGANAPFKDIAGGLSSQGIAVMRFDKRSYVYKDVYDTLSDVTVQAEIIRDIHYAVDLLRQTTGIDSTQIYVLGHGFGGTLLPRVAEQTDHIAGYIALGAPVRPLPQVILDEVSHLYAEDGDISADEKGAIDKLTSEANMAADSQLTPEIPREYLPLSMPGSYWIDLRRYDPIEKALIMSEPLLVLQGERDYQATMADFDKWRELTMVRDNVDTRSFPNLNHLFIRGQGKSSPMEYMVPGHIDREVIDYIANWIKKPKKTD